MNMLRQSVILTMFLKKLDFSSNRLGWKMIQLLATENSMTRICNNEITHIFWINLKIPANNYGSSMVDLLNNGFNTNIKKLQRERQPRRSSVLIVERNNVLSWNKSATRNPLKSFVDDDGVSEFLVHFKSLS